MNRRAVLRAGAGLVGAGIVGGCLQTESRSVRSPPLAENRPDAVYYPTHSEGMKMVGSTTAGEYETAAMYSYPHRFWEVTGSDTNLKKLDGSTAMHFMAVVWDPETKTVLPNASLTVELTKDGSLADQTNMYAMLSQPMGLHYGNNLEGNGDGTYTASIDIGSVPEDRVRRSGDFQGRFTEPETAEIEFEYSESARDDLPYQEYDDAGKRAALKPMDTMAPSATVPPNGELPGEVRGTATSGDAVFVVTVQDTVPAGIEGDGQYLAVFAHTPYNRMVLPSMTLSGALAGDSLALESTLDPDLGYHYGAAVSEVADGATLSITVDTPPQLARHEGYEMAFLTMPDMEVQL
ncbi:DUF7350 domain-containing protein [Halorientalis regularis]|uniref:DUF7350 domain-containing protein n=1 Tax=Halorientalis regularis TaxID=660518 RepID=A0A1G7KSH0_9EURY|nr:hypothetical protein [Halorientalis regularis]SDF40046.1 hypothetical protein SAMN05216218_1068 [Halorientalis regularis]